MKINLPPVPALGRAILFAAVLALVVGLQFRTQIGNGFSVLYGDRYDAAIVATILEHWFNVMSGQAWWSELDYFYPYTKTLGHTDGYFLLGLVYSTIRVWGFDPFLSAELTNMALKGIGFVAMYGACRSIFKISFGWALVAAALFTLSNSLTIHGQRLQLSTVAFAPIAALLLWHAVQALVALRSVRFVLFGSAAGMLLGAWAITCFYLTWFFLFYMMFFGALLLWTCGRSHRLALWRSVVSQKLGVLAVVVVTVLSLLPLLTVYLPKSKETGMRPYETVFKNTVPLEGVLQLGTDNFMFGRLYNQFLAQVSPTYAPNGEYYNTGIAPILFVLFVAGCVLLWRKKDERAPRFFLTAMCGATILTWLATLNVFGHSAWYFVYHLVPGAKALSVVSAYQMFLTFPVVIIGVLYLSSAAHKLPKAVAALLIVLLGLEELNSGYLALNRADEVARVTKIAPPPPACKAFFVNGWNNQATVTPMSEWINSYYAHNVSAMLIAQMQGLPTINGVASFNPPDWNFQYPNNPDYLPRIRAYADKHKVDNLCQLDLETKTWNVRW